MARTARIERSTKESSVLVELNLDGTGQIDIETGVPFLISFSVGTSRRIRSKGSN